MTDATYVSTMSKPPYKTAATKRNHYRSSGNHNLSTAATS